MDATDVKHDIDNCETEKIRQKNQIPIWMGSVRGTRLFVSAGSKEKNSECGLVQLHILLYVKDRNQECKGILGNIHFC